MSTPDLQSPESPPPATAAFTLDLELAKPRDPNAFAVDYYEILRISPQADQDTIERVYQTLSERFHPETEGTGDSATFLQLREAYETLSNPHRRARYNAMRQQGSGSIRFWLRAREFFDGVRGGQNRRLAVLCLLYRQRITNYEAPGLSVLDLERSTGCTSEEITSALWYLCEKKWAAVGESTAYSISCDGFDVVESKLEDRMEFRALATVRYYGGHPEPEVTEDVEPQFWKMNPLPLNIGPARAMEGEALVVDHYETLSLGPHADPDSIERVYQTLASRFHPDNPGTGDADAFRRVKEAWETLSDPVSRAKYDATRQLTKNSTRFHLRGREFFNGIRGEQLRRLAVLCLLYRQALSDSAGLTVLDMEQLTGCTREELGSALWYLREKRWARSGEYTEYNITAVGFDVVESSALAAAQSKPALAPQHASSSLSRAFSNGNSVLIVESAQPVLNADEPSPFRRIPEENAGIVQSGMKTKEPMPPSQLVQEPIATQLPDRQPSAMAGAAHNTNGAGGSPALRPPSWSWLYPDEHRSEVSEYPLRLIEPQPDPPAQVVVADPPAVDQTPEVPSAAVDPPLAASPQESVALPAEPAIPRVPVAAPPAFASSVTPTRRVILSMGGKGGVGKTSVMTGLAEWFDQNRLPVTLLDLDTENKACGSLTHFFGGRVPKINIHTPAGLDAFVDSLSEESAVVLADMGAGAGQITYDWFDRMYPDVAEAGFAFTAIGVITADPASVESVLAWAKALQSRVTYVVVQNHLTEYADFSYWNEHPEAVEFRSRCQPAVIRLDYRLADLENAVRNYGVTLGQVATRSTTAVELQKASLVMRAQSYRRRMFAEFDKVKELLLP